ncbi:hypothetical protein PHMEG_00023035 [Phytophthora megakarya]|uniref:DDE Tnp4 domain-containing protein n=1 Tax=Phytophthora megakarya TaxID=4795 RepID=A0A225VHZ7_9STRA|nr:hypothetical protein PHMEG_00023035 [Phytophthora megakarya]
MSLSTFEELLCILGPYLVVDYYRSLSRSRGIPPLTPAAMLQSTLSWLGGGSHHLTRVIAGISTSTFYRVVYRVMFAVNDVDKLATRFPVSPEEAKRAAAGFQLRSNHGVIEHCIGVIDDWLCPIRDECGRVVSFFSGNYQKYGLNVQACADALSRFTAFSVNSPGGMNDAYAYQRWLLSNQLNKIDDPDFVIGDNAYVQCKRVLTPFNKTQLVDRPDRDSYNFHVSQLRILVEMAFGLLNLEKTTSCAPATLPYNYIGMYAFAQFLHYTTMRYFTDPSRSSFDVCNKEGTFMEQSRTINLRRV